MTKKPTEHDLAKTSNNLVIGDMGTTKTLVSTSKYRLLIVVAVGLLFIGFGAYTALPNNGPCGGDGKLIDEYNSTMHSKGVYGLKIVSDAVEKKAGNEKDATCAYLKLMVSYGNAKKTGPHPVYDQFNALSILLKQGKRLSPHLDDGVDKGALFKQLQSEINDSKKGYYAQG